MDMISALPEAILHHIQSFLPYEHIVQTSILSKKWKHVYHSCLSIICGRFFSKSRNREILVKNSQNHHLNAISLEKFTVDVQLSDNYQEFKSDINRCLSYAVGSNVKELRLWICCPLPQLVFYVKSIILLVLDSCKLESTARNVTLSSLRKLCLRYFFADDQVINDLIAGCPLIESINIIASQGLKNLVLTNLRKLKELELYDNKLIERVYIDGVNVHPVDIKNVPFYFTLIWPLARI